MITDFRTKFATLVFASSALFLAACSSAPETVVEEQPVVVEQPTVTTTEVDPNIDPATGQPYVRVFYFDFDKATLSAEARAALDAHATRLRDKAGLSIRLEGHADERGTREYNLALGERRAKAVANYLAIQGVDAGRVQVISYGEEKPAAFGSDEASWQKNRRVELVDVR